MKQLALNSVKQLQRFTLAARIILVVAFILPAPSAMAFEWLDLWLTPDQQGQRLLEQGKYQQAADKFTSPEQIGTALFLAGDFKNAATVLGRSGSAEANYNRGNALLMQGLYDDAIESYQNALIKRPDWLEAEQNLELAKLRQQALAPPDDDFGGTGGQLEADEIVFDDTGRVNKSSSEQVMEASDEPKGEEAMRAMWLRKVETRPADFLAARFNYQLATRDNETTDGEAENKAGQNNE
jgi:Ca-activated chloride channel family protein